MTAAVAAQRIKSSVHLVRLVGETLPLKREGALHVGLCPFHGEKTPSFTVYADHFHCFGCGAHGDVFDWLSQAHGMTFAEAAAHLDGGGLSIQRRSISRETTAPKAPKPSEHLDLARQIWRESVDPHGTIAEAYLRHRGVLLPDAPVIRFHPHCPRKDGPLPAMVALMTDPLAGRPCGVHRTFLQPDGSGKAAIDRPKMMLGNAGVIRLVDDDEIGLGLGLSEGIETALTVMQRIGWGPVWAATSAGAIRTFPVWRATTLNIFADHDPAGFDAAHACAARWIDAGEEALIHLPPEGEDWADAAQRLAA